MYEEAMGIYTVHKCLRRRFSIMNEGMAKHATVPLFSILRTNPHPNPNPNPNRILNLNPNLYTYPYPYPYPKP